MGNTPQRRDSPERSRDRALSRAGTSGCELSKTLRYVDAIGRSHVYPYHRSHDTYYQLSQRGSLILFETAPQLSKSCVSLPAKAWSRCTIALYIATLLIDPGISPT